MFGNYGVSMVVLLLLFRDTTAKSAKKVRAEYLSHTCTHILFSLGKTFVYSVATMANGDAGQ